MNAVIYARYSSAGQTEQSIEGQLRVCHEFAVKMGYTVLKEYIDRATTGTNDNRPSFQEMIADSKRKEFTAIIVYKLDRFARNKYDSVVYKHKLKQNGVRVVSATEVISDSAEGKLVEGLLEMFAEMYSEDLSQKVKRGLVESRKKGTFTGGHVLFGYKVENKKIVIDPQKAEIVKYIFTEYAKGTPKKKLVAELNNRGYKNFMGNSFTIWNLNNNLQNKKYIGIVEHNGEVFTNAYPQLIDTKVFDKVQKMLGKNKRNPMAERMKVEYYLTGTINCLECGDTVVGVSGTSKTKGERHHYYACSRKYKKKTCDNKNRKKQELEDTIIKVTQKFVLDPDHMERIAELCHKEYGNDQNQVRIKDYENRLIAIQKEQDKCFQLMLKATDDDMIASADRHAKDLKIQKKDIEDEISKLKLATRLVRSKEDYKNYLSLYLETGDDEKEKRRIIQSLVNSIWIGKGKIKVYYDFMEHIELTFDDVKDDDDGGDDGDVLDFDSEIEMQEFLDECQENTENNNGAGFAHLAVRPAKCDRTRTHGFYCL